MEATSARATTQFMKQLKKMFEEIPDIIWDRGAIIIPDPAKLEKALPKYYKTSKFSSFQRQLNNFGYHRSYATNERVDRSKSRGVCYQKVAGAPPSVDIDGLLSLRPLVRRKKRPLDDDLADEPPRRRAALLLNLKPTPIAPMPLDVMSIDDEDAARSLLSLTKSASSSSLLL